MFKTCFVYFGTLPKQQPPIKQRPPIKQQQPPDQPLATTSRVTTSKEHNFTEFEEEDIDLKDILTTIVDQTRDRWFNDEPGKSKVPTRDVVTESGDTFDPRNQVFFYDDFRTIVDQIQERTIERMKEQEVRDKERLELLANI